MKIHIVQKGDTLWKIAQKYNVNFEQLKSMNTQLSDPNMLMPGMKIKVPTGSVHVKKHPKEAPINKKAANMAPPPLPFSGNKMESMESPSYGFAPMPDANIPMPAPNMNVAPMMQAPPPLPCGCHPVPPPCPPSMPAWMSEYSHPQYMPVAGEYVEESSSISPDMNHHHMPMAGMYQHHAQMPGMHHPHHMPMPNNPYMPHYGHQMPPMGAGGMPHDPSGFPYGSGNPAFNYPMPQPMPAYGYPMPSGPFRYQASPFEGGSGPQGYSGHERQEESNNESS